MLQELKNIEEKYRQLTLSLSNPALISDPQKIKEISKERASLEPLIKKYEDYKKVKKDIKEAEEILASPDSESDLKKLAEAEKESHIKKQIEIYYNLPEDLEKEFNVEYVDANDDPMSIARRIADKIQKRIDCLF